MPTIRKRTTVASDGTIGGAGVYPITGSQYEYLPFDAEIEFAIVARPQDASVGSEMASLGEYAASVYSGSDVLQQQDVITKKATFVNQTKTTDTAGQMDDGAIVVARNGREAVSRRDDFLVSDVAAAGERISVELAATSNPSEGMEIETVVVITPA